LVSERAVRGLFGNVQGLIANWGPLHFGPGESLNDHAAFKRFLEQSSLEGMDSALLYRVDYRGVSEAWQPTTAKEDDRARAWKFEAVLDAVHHTDLVHARGKILWEYFHLHIIQRITNWEQIKDSYDLVSYSVQRNVSSEHEQDHIPVVGYLRHGSDNMRRREVQGLLDGIPGLTVNWHAVRLGPGSRLASNTEYQEFLAASTKDEDGSDSNQNKRIRVDVRGSSDAAPKKRGPVTGSKQNRQALGSLDSLINSVAGALDTLPTLRLLDDSAAKRPKPSAARAPPAPSHSAATPAAAPTPAIRAQVRNSLPRPPAPRARAAAPHAARAPAPAPRRAGAAPSLPH
jgi:hypothetical protein